MGLQIIYSKQDLLLRVFWYEIDGAVCWQVTQENKEAEEIQAVVSQEEQSVTQQGAKTAALKGTHVNYTLEPQVSRELEPQTVVAQVLHILVKMGCCDPVRSLGDNSMAVNQEHVHLV